MKSSHTAGVVMIAKALRHTTAASSDTIISGLHVLMNGTVSEISRAGGTAELVTDDDGGLREQFEAAIGEQLSALEGTKEAGEATLAKGADVENLQTQEMLERGNAGSGPNMLNGIWAPENNGWRDI